jgi:hypothetical protein
LADRLQAFPPLKLGPGSSRSDFFIPENILDRFTPAVAHYGAAPIDEPQAPLLARLADHVGKQAEQLNCYANEIETMLDRIFGARAVSGSDKTHPSPVPNGALEHLEQKLIIADAVISRIGELAQRLSPLA